MADNEMFLEQEASQKPIALDIRHNILPVITILGFLAVWQVLAMTGILHGNAVAKPSEIFVLFIDKFTNPDPDGATIQFNILISLQVSLLGLVLGIVVGTPLGLLMGWYKPIDKFVRPLFELIRPIPPIAWIPLTILWIGVGLQAKVIIIFFSVLIPCLLNSYTGIQQTSLTLINLAKTFGASNFQIFLKIGVPSAMPMSFAGMRIALGNAWSTLVAAELLAANAGLGYMIMMGRQYSRPDLIILGMLVIGGLGYTFTTIFAKIENIVVRWRTV